MSITIVSRPSTPAQPSTAGNAAGGDAASDDFANLLVGQLALGTANDPAAAVVAKPAATKAEPEDDTDTATISPDATPDSTSLLATLALITPPVNSESTAPALGDQAGSAALSALPASSPFEKAAQTPEKPELPDATARLTNATTATTDNAAAKIAAAPTAVEDELSIAKDLSIDSPSNDVSTMTHNVHANADQHALRRDSSLSVSTPVRDQRWASEFGQKVVWLASADKQSAQLTLNPAEMGPIEISLSMDKGNATVSFASANAEVRDSIETALPRLREMFASAGIELGQTNVGAESFRQQAGNGQGNPSSSRSTADNAILAADPVIPLQPRVFAAQQGNGLVDLFA